MLDRLNGNFWYDTKKLTNKNRTRKIFLLPDLYSTYPLVLFRQKWTYERLVRWTAITNETNSYQIVFVVNKKKIVLSSEKLETKLKRWTRGKGIVYNISRSWLRIYIDIYSGKDGAQQYVVSMVSCNMAPLHRRRWWSQDTFTTRCTSQSPVFTYYLYDYDC